LKKIFPKGSFIMTLHAALASRGAIAARTLSVISILVCLAISASGAGAASRSSLAIFPPQGGDLTYLYADIADAGEIALRLQKSETLGFLHAPAKEMLAGLPAAELSLMVSVSGDEMPSFQMAWALSGENKPLLEKIAGGSASVGELGEFFGKISDKFAVQGPEDGTPFYRVNPFGLYFSSNGELLLFADSIEGVKKSMLAAGNSHKRFSPKTKSACRNLILLSLGKEPSAFFAESVPGFIRIPDGASFPEKISLEADVNLRPGGWELDLFTNAIRPFFADGFFERSAPKTYGSFFKAGGGRLLAAVDGIPSEELLLDGSYVAFLSDILGIGSGWDADTVETLIGRRAYGYLLAGLESSDRMNLAVTAAPDGGLSGYLTVSAASGTDWKRAGDEMSKAVSVYNEMNEDGPVKIKELPDDDWNRVFSIEAPEAESGAPAGVTAAFGENRALAGFLRPDLLKEPFVSGSRFYEALTKDANVLETMYVDMRFLRDTLRAIRAKNPDRGHYGRQAFFTIIPFLDFREIGAQTLSPEHIKFFFKTGWLDLEEREFINSIMQ
jgi:hypothetical protein